MALSMKIKPGLGNYKQFNAGLQQARRMGQTSLALQKAGWRWLRDRKKPLPELAVATVEDLGSTYIKLGQFIASSPSIFPHEYVEAFQTCLDQTQAIPFKVIEKILKKEFDGMEKKIFRHIDPEPLASASIAQVHAATLLNGDDIVIKVQKPGVENILETDFQFLQFSAKLAEKLSSRIPESSLTDIVNEIRNGMLEECDFTREARNIEAYRKFLEETGNTRVVVPKVYRQASTRKVLTMERFYGAPISDLDKVREYASNPEATLIEALNTWFNSLTHCQIYHADLHAGNVMILRDGRIGFLDFGIVGRISETTWNALLSLTLSVPRKDYLAIAEALITIGATNQHTNKQAFADDIRQLVERLQSDNSYHSADDFLQEITLEISRVARTHGVRFPREFTLLIKQFLYFDRYIRILAPELEMFSDDRVEMFAPQQTLF